MYKKGELPYLLIYILLLVAILFFKPEQLHMLNSTLGKFFLCSFIFFSAYTCGKLCGIVSVLISIIALHNVYEGFENEKLSSDEPDESDKSDESTEEDTEQSVNMYE